MLMATMPENRSPFIAFHDVDKTYDGSHFVVEGLNLQVARGEFLSLLGPSGSGKTTTLMMLAGFEMPTRGHILLDGQRLDDKPPHQRDIGMVFQNYALFPHLTIEQNVAFPLSVRHLSKTEQQARVRRALDALIATARGTGNLMPAILDAVRAYATLGEMCDALREVWGEYEEVPFV